MGCDIHMMRESLVDGVWICNDTLAPEGEEGVPKWVRHGERIYWGRNYRLFTLLAGVRDYRGRTRQLFTTNGFPPDASVEAAAVYTSWGTDAHTPSYLTVADLTQGIEDMSTYEFLYEVSDDHRGVHGSLFEWDSFKLEFQRWINDLNSYEGDDHRVVFFFDN